MKNGQMVVSPFGSLLLAGLLLAPQAGTAAVPRPGEAPDNKVVGALLATDFSQACDLSTYPLKKNLSYLFENKYIGLEFRSWAVEAAGDGAYRVVLHYVDGRAGPTRATWTVNPGDDRARMGNENAETLSCLTGYL
jgi:hypothetical protein